MTSPKPGLSGRSFPACRTWFLARTPTEETTRQRSEAWNSRLQSGAQRGPAECCQVHGAVRIERAPVFTARSRVCCIGRL